VAYLIYATISQVMQIQGSLLNLIGAVISGTVTVMIAVSFPAKIIVASGGLQQVSWLWKNKRISWEDIVEINTGEKSRMVTITDSDGTKIVHSRVLPDRPRLLIELRHHCGENLPLDFPHEAIAGPEPNAVPD
jgi:hypothetical protein